MSQGSLRGTESINMKNIQPHSSQVYPNAAPHQDEAVIPAASGPTRIFLDSDSDSIQQEKLPYKDLDEIKELGLSMARKRQIRKQLIAEIGRKVGSSKWKSEVSEKWRRFKENATDAIAEITLWKKALHEIEGRFGSAIRSYFAFLRWLFVLNIYIFLLVFSFVVIPTIVFENLDNSAVITEIAGTRNISAACAYNPYDPNSINSFQQYIIWWFTGQGFMENTLLFMGYYDNIATTDPRVGFYFNYDIPLAYLLVAFFYFLLSLAFVVKKAASGWKESLNADSRICIYCTQMFCGWDYCISDIKSAELKHSNVKNDIQVELYEEKIKMQRANRTRNQKIVLYSKRILANILIIGIVAGSLFAIFYAAQFSLQNISTYDNEFFLDLLVTYLTSIVITVANFIAPFLFDLLIQWEDYSPDFTIKLTLIRTVVLRLASVVFLYVVVYLQIFCNRYSLVRTQFDPVCLRCEGMECWETYLGQEMYKLTILDFFIVIAVTLFVEFPRKLIVDHCKCGLSTWVGHQEFDIPTNVLAIVYAQTVGWIGTFYAPLLPVLIVIKFFVFFYLKKLTLLNNCKPASRPYRTSRSGTFFYVILIFGFAVAVFPVAISVSIISPSTDCGPFRSWQTMFFAVTSSIGNLPTWAQEMFWFFGSSPFAAILIVILSVALYYTYSMNSANKSTIRLLKNQLAMNDEDKDFLTRSYSRFGRQSRRRN